MIGLGFWGRGLPIYSLELWFLGSVQSSSMPVEVYVFRFWCFWIEESELKGLSPSGNSALGF